MKELYELYLQHLTICTDSRQTIPGCLFFCLKGEHFDGNQFAEQALQAGAAVVITERKDLSDPRYVVVDDSLASLQQLASYHRKQLNIPVIGITGTNGKTTTKELTAAVLSEKFKTAFTQGNLNNHIGVPLTILSIRHEHEIAIVEMGANHPGEIEFLCQIAQPDFGLITNIGKAHLEGFGTVEEIAHTKKALYRSVMNAHGTLFVNASSAVLCEGLQYDKIQYYAESGEKAILTMSPYLEIMVGNIPVKTRLTGSYNVYNCLAAAAVGRFFGVADEQIANALNQYAPSNHRSQISIIGTNTVIADYYNANPTSMEAALHNLDLLKAPRKVAILGDMLELGEVSAQEHTHIVEFCKKRSISAYFVGENFHKLHPQSSFKDVDALNAFLLEHPITESLVLVKGSRGIHLEKLSLLA